MLNASEQFAGFGNSHTLEIDGAKIFVKRLPVTDIEQANFFSTKNLYGLPLFYQYGLGSAGFGVFRELVAHIKTTNWVLNNEIQTFPLLYHYRIMPFSGKRNEVDAERFKRYVHAWGNNKNIEQYTLDRAHAPYEIVLFLEHIPHVLQSWLSKHLDQIQHVFDELWTTINFLQKKGMIHFDLHFGNILTDGEQIYLTDFGLIADKNFSLLEEEISFFNAHANYDYGMLVLSLYSPILTIYKDLPEIEQNRIKKDYGLLKDDGKMDESINLYSVLLKNIEEIQAKGILKINDTYLKFILKYHNISLLMHDFFLTMIHNHKKDTEFPTKRLNQLLEQVGLSSHQEAN